MKELDNIEPTVCILQMRKWNSKSKPFGQGHTAKLRAGQELDH